MVGSCTSDRGARAAPVRNRWAPRLAQLPAGQMQYEDGGAGGQTGLGQSKRHSVAQAGGGGGLRVLFQDLIPRESGRKGRQVIVHSWRNT